MASSLTAKFVADALSNEVWDLGNEVLHCLCREHPDHKTDSVILAKIWLIGRSYAAAIERRRQVTDGVLGDAFYETEVAPQVRQSPIDEWFSSLRQSATGDIATVLEVHRHLMDLFRRISGMDKRSLASKYLHFHFPERFYIYDSRAAKAISELVPPVKRDPNVRENDGVYAAFFSRCQELNRQISIFRPLLLPRELDKVLLRQVAKPAHGA